MSSRKRSEPVQQWRQFLGVVAEHTRRVSWWDRELSLLQAIHECLHLRHHPVSHVAQSEEEQRPAEVVHLKVVDHLIVTADETFSFRTAGLL